MWVKCGVATVKSGVGTGSMHAAHARRRRRLSRGQAMVEFALVAPLFFLLFFGFIEYALISASIAAYNFAAKEGARVGSLLGRTDGTVDTQILNSVNLHVAGIVMAKPVELEIFKSDVAGDYLLPGNSTAIEDAYVFSSNSWTVQTWVPDSRDDTLVNADYLGVRITYQYTYLTAFVSGGNSSLQLTANSVQRIEPQDYQSHRTSPPAVMLVILPGTLQLVHAAPDIWVREPVFGGQI